MEDLKEFIARNMAHSPIEAKIVKKVFKALKAAGTPIVKVWDTEEWSPVTDLDSLNQIVFNLDWAQLTTEDGSYVIIVMGNEWDALSDYTLDLDAALAPVNEWIEKNY